MKQEYPAKYQDQYGEITTHIRNDGHLLEIELRGVIFSGADFDSLEPTGTYSTEQLAQFTLSSNSLCACHLEWEVPFVIVADDEIIEAQLTCSLKLGHPRPNVGIDEASLQLDLAYSGKTYSSGWQGGWFDDALLALRKEIPANHFFKSCWGCAYSDYSPIGHGCFGDLACFRDNKALYLNAESKQELLEIWDTMTEYVQETHLCEQFQQRQSGTGYRG